MLRPTRKIAALARLGLAAALPAQAFDGGFAREGRVFEPAAGPLPAARTLPAQAFLGDGTLFGSQVVPQNCEQSATTSKVVGGVVGALVGGLLGSQIGGGSGKTVATIAGTGLGIVLGSTAGGYVAAQNPDCAPQATGRVYSERAPDPGTRIYHRQGQPRDLFGQPIAFAPAPADRPFQRR